MSASKECTKNNKPMPLPIWAALTHSTKSHSLLSLKCTAHLSSQHRPQLTEAVASTSFDWITITSPEAAAVLVEAWQQAGKPQVRRWCMLCEVVASVDLCVGR